MTSRELRTLIGEKIDVRWSEWAPKHPHLAETIDRVRLIEATVDRLRDDPRYIEAMDAADHDTALLAGASTLIGLLDDLIKKLLPV